MERLEQQFAIKFLFIKGVGNKAIRGKLERN
jgi:hypothetical protein